MAMAHCGGISYGYSKFMENVCIVVILYFGTWLMLDDPSLNGENVFIAIFGIVFGAFGAG